jgi:tetratricopeptide (TPR) repeat protein
MFFRPTSLLNLSMRQKVRSTFVVTGLLVAFIGAPAFADDLADINKLMRAGQYGDALIKVDALLAKTPRDAQSRFLKGVILTEQNKSPEAIAQFTRLIEDFPDLPEPYNNLAVLYASSGQYEKSRASLEMAIRTNPTYATAYENLGDVHARLASQAYDKALQLDSANNAAKSKLTLVRSLVGNTTGGTNPKTGVPSVAVVAAAPAPVSKPAPAAPVAPVAPVVAKAEPAKPVAPPPALPVVVKAEVVKPEPAPAPAVVAKVEAAKVVARVRDDEKDEVLGVVNAWAKAWSARDTKGYFNAYSNDFQSAKRGESRKTWMEERTLRITEKDNITVEIQSPQVAIANNTATVKFRQTYVAGSLKSEMRKTLVLTKQNGKWQIKQERASN